jgi:hypothetical protein
MQKFDAIRPFYDSEINEALQRDESPYDESIDELYFSDVADEVWKEQFKTQSIRDFQCNFIYQSVQRVLKKVLMD